ncbi:tryptophan 2,3-dioxygenase family protein [Streptomyces mutomycini]|uniref:Tryptophan 2,3-dioxygenase family protein n=1 Tax=Streptomyces mutomycini TaxID=284036 RepID=A0ABW0B197_9ACTN|nr:tryptophan 2,3-dioxygenase family protein [Streptomyces mutomycini]
MTSPTYATYLRLDELLSLQQPLTPAEQRDLSDSERLFIVVHQASETLLSQVLVDLRHIDAHRCGQQCFSQRVERAARLVDALAGQLTLLHRTLRREDFLRFRDRFGTASGLDSEQFKELFSRVRRLTKHGADDRSPQEAQRLGELGAAVGRWRSTHLELVDHMLGDRPGTGETSGARFLAARLGDVPAGAEPAGAEPAAASSRPDHEDSPDAQPLSSSSARPSSARPSLGHVVVVGGSVAGLLTAHVLADHARRVTVLERDHYEQSPGPRAGVPQSRHTHVLLTSGMNALDELLPGLLPELTDAGAPRVAVPGDLGVWQAGQWISRRNPSAPIMTPSRPFLENHVRRHVLADSRIEVRTGVETTGLLGRPGHITGVVVRDRGVEHGSPQELTADLVVDATGRGSRTPRWLTELGDRPPAEEVVETGRAYATCVFHADDPAEDLRGFYVVPDAEQPFGAIILPVEGGRWSVTLSGPRGQAPPTDPEGFVDFADRLPHPAPYKWLSAARPVARPVGYRHTANRRRRYDRRGRGATGLLVIGDALCAFNPVYGQGLSVAALNAVALRDVLAGGGTPSAHVLQRAVLRSSHAAWAVATGADSPMPGAIGNAVRTGPVARLLNRYLSRVRAHVPSDPVVCAANRDVLFLLNPPHSLLTSPQVLRRVLLRTARPTSRDLPTP